MRLIDADAVKETIQKNMAEIIKSLDNPYLVVQTMGDIIGMIDDAPTIEPSGDLISRADAIESVCNDCEGEHYPRCSQQKYCIEVNGLLALPSADRPKGNSAEKEKSIEQFLTLLTINALSDNQVADRPKGEWKWKHGGECSECGFHNNNFDFNYCPNCGADMIKDGDR